MKKKHKKKTGTRLPANRSTQNSTNILSHDKAMSNRMHFTLAAFLFAVAIMVRIYKYTVIPEGIHQDTAMSSVNALSLLNYGTDRFGMRFPIHFAAWRFSQQSSLLSYITVPFIAAFGFNQFAVLLPSLIISLFGMVVLFLFVKKAFSRQAALIVLAMCVINPWHIIQSRWSVDCNLFPHFLLFSMYFLFLGTEKKYYLYISMVLFGITMYSYGMAIYSVPLILMAACIYLLKQKTINFKETAICAGIYTILSLPIFLMVIINVLKLPSIVTPFFTIPYFPYTDNYDSILFYSNNFHKQLYNNIGDFFNTIFVKRENVYAASAPPYGAMYSFSMLLIIFALTYTYILKYIFRPIKKQYDCTSKFFRFLLTLWLITSCIVGIITNNLALHRINIIFYPLIILLGLSIYWIGNFIKISYLKKLYIIAIMLVYGIAFNGFVSTYFSDENQNTAYKRDFYSGFKESIEYIDRYDYDKIYITSNSQNYNSSYVSEILTMFHHKMDAEYIQDKRTIYDNKGTPLLPYTERYNYISFTPERSVIGSIHQNEIVSITQAKVQNNDGTGLYQNFTNEIIPNTRTVFVMNNSEAQMFSQDDFDIMQYKYYSAIVPKGAVLK